jgi:hypothetical protein
MRDRIASIRPAPAGCRPVGQFVQDVAHQGRGVDLAQNRRGFAHRHGIAAEGFHHQPQPGKVGRSPARGGLICGKFHDFGDQQRLRGDPASAAWRFRRS